MGFEWLTKKYITMPFRENWGLAQKAFKVLQARNSCNKVSSVPHSAQFIQIYLDLESLWLRRVALHIYVVLWIIALSTFTFVLFLLHELYVYKYSWRLLYEFYSRVWCIIYDQVEWLFILRILFALGFGLSIALKHYPMPYRVLLLRNVPQSRLEFSNISDKGAPCPQHGWLKLLAIYLALRWTWVLFKESSYQTRG